MDWNAELENAGANMETYQGLQPAGAEGFGALHGAAMASGALDTKHKELMALAIGIAKQCIGCIAFHVKAAVEAGAIRDEIAETVTVCIMMGGGPSYIYGTKALECFDALDLG